MKYQLAIFDCDGTLADTLPWMRSIFNEVAATHGLRSVSPEEDEQLRLLQGRELLKALGLPLWKLPRVTRDFRGRMAAHKGQFELFPGIAESLRRVASAGIRLAIVSSNCRQNVERVLSPQVCGLIHDFDCGASMFGKASKVRRVVGKSGLKRAIYIGDEVRDAEGAREAGVAFGAVAWGHHPMAILQQQAPEECFSTPPEIGDRLCEDGATEN